MAYCIITTTTSTTTTTTTTTMLVYTPVYDKCNHANWLHNYKQDKRKLKCATLVAHMSLNKILSIDITLV